MNANWAPLGAAAGFARRCWRSIELKGERREIIMAGAVGRISRR
jgi:hypothetical protein